MATPLSASSLLAALKAEGLKVAEHRSWRTHNRNHKGRWGDVHGVVIHHTAGRNSLALCYDGTPALPGPLCHNHLAKNGIVTMVSAGRANHAGTFAANAHAAVRAEAAFHPRPDAAETVDGNRHYYGLEIENLGDGKDPYPVAQYDAAVRWAAAICRAHGWSENSVIGHREGTRRKIDPSFSMDMLRTDVAARLARSAGSTPGTTPPLEDAMTLTDSDVKKVWNLDGFIEAPTTDAANPHWAPASLLRDTNIRTRALQTTVAAQSATITELVKAVASLASGIGDLDPAAIVAELSAAIESVEVRLDVPDEVL